MTTKPSELTEEDRWAIRAAVAEVDLQQAEIDRHLTPAQRARKAFSMSNMVRHIAVYPCARRGPS